MPPDVLIIVLGLVIGLPILIILIGRGVKFRDAAAEIKVGMSFDEVKNIAGEPDNTSVNDNIMTCTWTIHGVPRIGIIKYTSNTRVVVFKDDRVVSVTNS